MNNYISSWIMVGVLALTSLISCREGESGEVVENAEENLTLDELGQKIREEQRGEMVIPESSLIAKMEYFKQSKHLIIHFQRDPSKAYLYQNVPEEVWVGVKSAESKGQYFREKIRDVDSFQMNH